MVTQKANLTNPVTTVSTDRDRNSEKGILSLTESFQSFAAVSNARWNQKGTADSGVQQKAPAAEATHRDTYERETVATDAYSVNKDKIQGGKLSKEPAEEDMELTQEQLEALEKDIRDVIKDALDMDDAELDEILAVMNVNILSLLEPGVLQEFLLTATESEPVDLLTDSSMIDLFQQMKGGIAQVLQEYGLEEADVDQLLQKFTAEGSEELPQMPQKDTLVPADMEMSDKSMDMDESAEEPEQTEIHTEQQRVQPESRERVQTEKNDSEGFTVKEENTGIQVSVQAQGAQSKAGQESGRQPEQFQQGIASEVVNQLTQAMGELEETPVSFTSELQQTEIIRQVIEQIRLVSGSDMNRMEVQLYPQHLGRVQIQVMMKNGAMTAQIHAETEMAKQAIESQLQQLKDTFQEKSIRVEAVEVSVGTPEFRNEQERQDTTKDHQKSRSGNGRIRLDEFGMPVEEAEGEEDTPSEILAAQGASVEFTA